MKTKWPPDPIETLQPLREVLELVHDALTYGADEGVKHHDARARGTIDPWLYSHVARDDAKHFMLQNGISEMGYTLADIPNSGLYLRGHDLEIRVLKMARVLNKRTGAFERGVPQPGSELRREYFYQPGMMLDALLEAASPLKLVALWEHDDLHQLAGLDVACPRGWNPSRNCVETYWVVPASIASDNSELNTFSQDPIMLEDLDVREHEEEGQAADNVG